jgi:hypothetical protein
MNKKSALQKARAAYQPKLPSALWGAVTAVKGEPTNSVANQDEIKALFRLCKKSQIDCKSHRNYQSVKNPMP